MPTKEEQINQDRLKALMTNNKDFKAAIEQYKKSTEASNQLTNLVKKQQIEIIKGQSQIVKQGSTLKQFVAKQSPLMAKTFQFLKARKEGKEAGKLRSIFNLKTLGPTLIKGLSLGLMKFGVGGAIGAAKIIDLTEQFQEFRKESEDNQREAAIGIIDQLMKDGKTQEEVINQLKKDGLKAREANLTFEAYRDSLDKQIVEQVKQGDIEEDKDDAVIEIQKESIEASIKASDIIDEALNLLLFEQEETTKELQLQRVTAEKRLELEKQIEQNEALRHTELMDSRKEVSEESGGFFSSLLGSFTGLKKGFGMLGGIVTKIGGLITMLAPVVAVAATAFIAYKVGGFINKGINKVVEFFTGTKGETLGGLLFDFLHPSVESRKIAQDKFFATREGQKILKTAKEKGFKVTATTTRKELDDFLLEYNKQLRAEKQKTRTQEINQIEKINKKKLTEERKNRREEDRIFQEKILTERNESLAANININQNNGTRLDKIPANSDDLQFALMAKGGIS